MLHTVEVGSFRGDLIAAFSNMMTWLNSRGSHRSSCKRQPGMGPHSATGSAAKQRHWPSFVRPAAGWSAKCPRVSPSGCADPNRVTDCRLQPPQSQRILAPIARR
jgi:hypothetical protein